MSIWSTLVNTGTVDLADGILTGAARLNNNAGGAVSGRRAILLNYYNQCTLPVITATTRIPEPGTLAFAAFGAFALLIARRKR